MVSRPPRAWSAELALTEYAFEQFTLPVNLCAVRVGTGPASPQRRLNPSTVQKSDCSQPQPQRGPVYLDCHVLQGELADPASLWAYNTHTADSVVQLAAPKASLTHSE